MVAVVNLEVVGLAVAQKLPSGTDLHVDPDVTDAWNGVLTGSKWWAYVPNDLYDFKEELVPILLISI
jgi:hypothetical protein